MEIFCAGICSVHLEVVSFLKVFDFRGGKGG
jgi:hypothetical protein